MANFVFKLRGLGAEPTFGLAFPLGDNATTRALTHLRQSGETTNAEVLTRLWNKWMEEIIIADYLARKAPALATAAAAVAKEASVPVVDNT